MVQVSKSDSLTHWGILGQKWGVRRFQNPDGTLTEEGRRRYAKGEITYRGGKLVKVKKGYERPQSTEDLPKPSKKIKDMSDDELKEFISRKTNERNAYQLKQDINRLNPQEVSKGKEFLNKVLNQVIVPATMNVGRQYLEKVMKEAIGLQGDNQNNQKKKEE